MWQRIELIQSKAKFAEDDRKLVTEMLTSAQSLERRSALSFVGRHRPNGFAQAVSQCLQHRRDSVRDFAMAALLCLPDGEQERRALEDALRGFPLRTEHWEVFPKTCSSMFGEEFEDALTEASVVDVDHWIKSGWVEKFGLGQDCWTLESRRQSNSLRVKHWETQTIVEISLQPCYLTTSSVEGSGAIDLIIPSTDVDIIRKHWIEQNPNLKFDDSRRNPTTWELANTHLFVYVFNEKQADGLHSDIEFESPTKEGRFRLTCPKHNGVYEVRVSWSPFPFFVRSHPIDNRDEQERLKREFLGSEPGSKQANEAVWKYLSTEPPDLDRPVINRILEQGTLLLGDLGPSAFEAESFLRPFDSSEVDHCIVERILDWRRILEGHPNEAIDQREKYALRSAIKTLRRDQLDARMKASIGEIFEHLLKVPILQEDALATMASDPSELPILRACREALCASSVDDVQLLSPLKGRTQLVAILFQSSRQYRSSEESNWHKWHLAKALDVVPPRHVTEPLLRDMPEVE
jgi:hypothetical protein